MIIEDSDEEYEAIGWALQKTGRGCLLKRFATSEEALDYLRETPFPLFIMLD